MKKAQRRILGILSSIICLKRNFVSNSFVTDLTDNKPPQFIIAFCKELKKSNICIKVENCHDRSNGHWI